MNMRPEESPPWKWLLISLTRSLRYSMSRRQTGSCVCRPRRLGAHGPPLLERLRFQCECSSVPLSSRDCSTRTVGCSLFLSVSWWWMTTRPCVKRWHPWPSNPYSAKSTLRKKIGFSIWLPPGLEQRRLGLLLVIFQWKVLAFGVRTLKNNAYTLLN